METDFALTARLTLLEFLAEINTANVFHNLPNGAAALASFAAEVEHKMREQASGLTTLTAEEREEYAVNAATICQRFFAKAEQRHAAFVRR